MNLKNLLLASIILSCLQLEASRGEKQQESSQTLTFESSIKAENTALYMMWLTAGLTGLYGCLSGLAAMPAAPVGHGISAGISAGFFSLKMGTLLAVALTDFTFINKDKKEVPLAPQLVKPFVYVIGAATAINIATLLSSPCLPPCLSSTTQFLCDTTVHNLAFVTALAILGKRLNDAEKDKKTKKALLAEINALKTQARKNIL